MTQVTSDDELIERQRVLLENGLAVCNEEVVVFASKALHVLKGGRRQHLMESRAVQKRGHEDLRGVVEVDDSLGLGLYGKVLEHAALHDAHSFRVPARRQREIDSVNAISEEIKDVPDRGQKKMGVIQRKGGCVMF